MPNTPNPDAPACDCRWFEGAVKDELVPVVFDELMNEYHLVHKNGGVSLFYYCPFCGGRAPESLRRTYFTEVTMDESYRLHELTKNIKTPQELFSAFGTPDHDFEIGGGVVRPGSQTEAPESTVDPRRVVYKSLSDIADVHAEIDRYDRLKFFFTGKYIGPERGVNDM